MADIAIEFIKDHEWELNGVKKFTIKGTTMIGDFSFLNQFVKEKVAKDVSKRKDELKKEIDKILNLEQNGNN